MNCKNHNEREGTFICSVCGEDFCEDCFDSETNQCKECKVKATLSKDILDDILNNVDMPSNTIANFDPTDILKQIEEEITLQQEFDKLDFDISSELNNSNNIEKLNFSSNGITATENKNDMDLNLLVEGFVSEDESSEALPEETSEANIDVEVLDIALEDTIDTVVESTTVEVETSTTTEETTNTGESKESSFSKIKEKVLLTKDAVIGKASNFDTDGAKESIKTAADSTKTQASKLSKEAKVKTASVAAGVVTGAAITKEKAADVKNTAKQKMDSNKKEMDSILNKIKDENANGEYDHLLGRFTTTYGQDKRADDGDKQSALPLRINSIVYFLLSLIPGAAQLYLGLTTRGITILLIGACFFFITNTPSLFIITAIVSFADAYKLRNIYHRGGKIEDTNNDVMGLIKQPMVILLIIAAIIFDIM